MATNHIRQADRSDVPALVALMTEFYAEADYVLPQAAAARTFERLIDQPRLGCVWILEADGEPAGYVVMTVCFSMEFGGLRGFVDDLFVRQRFRNRGLATAGLSEVRRVAEALGVRALLVETGHTNDVARRVYGRQGFVDSERLLMSLPLASAVHEPDA